MDFLLFLFEEKSQACSKHIFGLQQVRELIFQTPQNLAGGNSNIIWNFRPENLGGRFPPNLTCAYFSDGWVGSMNHQPKKPQGVNRFAPLCRRQLRVPSVKRTVGFPMLRISWIPGDPDFFRGELAVSFREGKLGKTVFGLDQITSKIV